MLSDARLDQAASVSNALELDRDVAGDVAGAGAAAENPHGNWIGSSNGHD